MQLQVGTISSSGSSPIVRVAAAEPWLIKRALDCGAHGIMVPMCDSASQAEAIVRACKYPSARWPQGVRGAGAMFAQAAFNQTSREYLLGANENVTIIVQIESRAAIEQVEAIAAVNGIDALFVGPNDLASSMGYVAFDHASKPEVQEAISRILRAALDAGKFAGHFALSAEAAALRVRQGFHFVNCGADIFAVTAWMSSEMAKLRTLIKGDGDEGQKGDDEAQK
ncbi:Pyruvate/Phosphoenolpyruvate kinase-like domain-containing protein [Xylariaceae sp. FL0255]|nr:Pyruvate/Phosphoenolpyruvate kinase-like domain-containing protein [Xylariaceae sp. FL0255]